MRSTRDALALPGRSGLLAIALALLGAAAAAAPAAGQLTLFEGGDVTATVGGYVRSITGFQDLGYDLPVVPGLPIPARQSGFHSEVVRVKWLVTGGHWRFELHDRFQGRVTSDAGEQVVGFGVTTVPDRLVDLSSDFVQRERLHVWHDIDRLSLSVFTDAADITVGRQAITWGTAMIFPVADLWTHFAPFEQETEEKPGLDAIRALFYPADGLEVDAVIADRGSAEDVSAGVRGTLSLGQADLWAGVGKFWREIMAMGGVTVLGDETKYRLEAAFPWNLDGGEPQRPRITAGVDWIRGTLVVTGEYHYNGIGAVGADGYVDVAADPRLQRGETYYLGRNYLGALVSWSPDVQNRLTLAASALVNLGDGSLALTPVATYDLGQATRLSLGALVSAGEEPRFQLTPPDIRLRSEFGAYGSAVFTMMSVYF